MEEKNTKYKNILIIALRKIGDTIIATSVAYLLRKAYPNATISILVRPLSQEIVRNNPVIDEILLYDYTHRFVFKEMRETIGLLREKQFDLAVISDNKPRSAMLAWLAGIPSRYGFEKIEFRNIYLRLFYTNIIKIRHDAMRTQQVKNHEIFIHALTGRDDTAKMVMADISPVAKEKIDCLWKSLNEGSNELLKIALCVRSGCLMKDWPLAYFSETVEALTKEFPAVFFIIGSANDKEAANWLQEQTSVKIHNLCGLTSLPELAYLLQKMDCFLSVDTGSAHIAAAVNVPTITVFGGTSPEKWGPYGENVINVAPINCDCHPCDGKKGCVEPKCLSTVKVERVVLEMSKKLKSLV